MPDPNKIIKVEKKFFVDDGAKRGPMTMFRVCFHPEQPQLAAQVADRRVALFDLAAEATQEVKGRGACVVGDLACPHEIGWIRSVAFSPDGKWLATGGSDRSLRLWPWNEGRPAGSASLTVDAHLGWVEAIAFSPDGSCLLTVGADQQVKIWNAADLRLIHTLAGHARYGTDVVFTRDGSRFITGAEDGRALVWDARSFEPVKRIEFGAANDQFGQNPRHSGVHRLAISRDDRWLGIAGGEKIALYDLTSGAAVATERVGMQIAFHPRADLLAGGEGEVKFWNYQPGKLTAPAVDKNGRPGTPAGISGSVVATVKRGDFSLGLIFSPDGRQVAMGKADGTLELYDVC